MEPLLAVALMGVAPSNGSEAGFASPEPPAPPARTNRLSKGGGTDSSIPREAAKMTLRCQLNRRCSPLSDATTAQIQALPVEKLEVLADALLDFQGPADLAAGLAANS